MIMIKKMRFRGHNNFSFGALAGILISISFHCLFYYGTACFPLQTVSGRPPLIDVLYVYDPCRYYLGTRALALWPQVLGAMLTSPQYTMLYRERFIQMVHNCHEGILSGRIKRCQLNFFTERSQKLIPEEWESPSVLLE